jgi:hypothetical protein
MVVFRRIGIGSLLCLLLAYQAQAGSLNPGDGLPNCPALDNGERLDLRPQLSGDIDFVSSVDFKNPAFLKASRQARNIASYFEHGAAYIRGGSYDGIGPLDNISIGQMQWNWKGSKGTLIGEFFKPIPDGLVNETTDPKLRNQLRAMIRYARSRNSSNRSEAEKVVKIWGDYVNVNSPHNDSVLAMWLRSPKVRAYQDKLVKDRIGDALVVARTWMRDAGYGEDQFERVMTTFANFNIHAGLRPSIEGLRGVWVPQVRQFKAALGNDRERIFQFVIDWMKSCENVADMTKKGDALGVPHWGVDGNILQWSSKEFIQSLSDEQVDLFSYAFVYATRSNTEFAGRQRGYSQLDAFQRGAVILLGKGRALGEQWDSSRY